MDMPIDDVAPPGEARDIFVVRADQNVGRRLPASAYQSELRRDWVWAQFAQDVDKQRFTEPGVVHDVLQIYRVLEVHFAYQVSQLAVQSIAQLSETENTITGRAFYGELIAHFYQHLEVFGSIVDDIRTRFANDGIDLNDDSSLAAVYPAYKYQQLLEKNPQPMASYDLRIHAVVFNYIFCIGGIAALRALHARVNCTGLSVWDNIRCDTLGLVRRHWQFLSDASAVDVRLMLTAYEVEATTSLEFLSDDIKRELKGYMMDLFDILPLPAVSPAMST